MRHLPLLVVALSGTSCVVPPTCIGWAFGPSRPNDGHLVTLTVYAGPIAEPPQGRESTEIGMWERFERGAAIIVDARGRMAVSSLNMWPESCPRISQEDLGEVSRSWHSVLEQMVARRTGLQVMENPYTWNDDWRPDGPLLSLSFSPASGKDFGLLWDGRSSLPRDLDTAVMATLEMMCSNSRRAKRYLFRDLPPQVTSRLECR